jgi:hypothetical protein
MSKASYMVGWVCELTNGSTRRGTIGVPAENQQQACAAVAGLVRNKFRHEAEEVTVVPLGPA